MGSGSSASQPRAKPTSFRNQYSQSGSSSPPPPRKPKPQPLQRRPVEFQQSTMSSDFSWPLPPRIKRESFKVNEFEDDRYSLPERLASPVPPDNDDNTRAVNPDTRQQTETSNHEWKMVDSQSDNSAHVQSQLTARSDGVYRLATSTDIDVLLQNLKGIYKSLDERVKRRLDEVSTDADKILVQILDEAEKEQKLLLIYDKEQQKIQTDLYQEWLQRYVVELNKWRSQELSELQNELMFYQKQIADNSQKYIEMLSAEANSRKMNVLEEEQGYVKAKIQDLTEKIHRIVSADNLQLLGSESKTEFNLRIQANVGRMCPP